MASSKATYAPPPFSWEVRAQLAEARKRKTSPEEPRPIEKRPRNDYNGASHYQQQQSLSRDFNQNARVQPSRSPDGHPQLLSFISWTLNQPQSMSHHEKLRKYKEYEREFKTQRTTDIFEAHQHLDWFRSKYHPDGISERKQDRVAKRNKRLSVFMEFMREGRFDGVSLNKSNSEKLIQLMDYFVARLDSSGNSQASTTNVRQLTPDEKMGENKVQASKKILEHDDKEKEKKGEKKRLTKRAKTSRTKEQMEKSAIRKQITREHEWCLGSLSDTDFTDTDDEERYVKLASKSTWFQKKFAFIKNSRLLRLSESDTDSNDESKENDSKTCSQRSTSGSSTDQMQTESETSSGDSGFDSSRVSHNEPDEEGEIFDDTENTEAATILPGKDEPTELPTLPPAPSIFIHNLHPSVTKQELETLLKKYPGFVRVAISDPKPDQQWFRHAWITFEGDVNIFEIRKSLFKEKLCNTSLSSSVNRDLSPSDRVRSVSGITAHVAVVRNDIRLAAKTIRFLDAENNLWNTKEGTSGVTRKECNPVLERIQNISGVMENDRDVASEKTFKVLDLLLFYLRFVHSVDYYFFQEFPLDDEMPNRLAFFSVREMPSFSMASLTSCMEHNRNFEKKTSRADFLQANAFFADDKSTAGMKSEQEEVKKFISKNSIDFKNGDWLCPLLGRNFKAPELIQTHIASEFPHLIDEVKKKVKFFNNFARDFQKPKSQLEKRRDYELPLQNKEFNRNQIPFGRTGHPHPYANQ